VRWYTILKYPVKGHVSLEKWVQIATGYVTFSLLGTGVDANAHYTRFLVRIGAGRLWPSLHVGSKNSSRGPNSFIASRSWTADLASKAKSIFWSSRSGSTSASSTRDVFTHSACNNSVGLDSIPRLHNVTTQDTLLSQKHNPSIPTSPQPSPQPSFFKRWFARPAIHGPLLPLFSYRNITEINSNTITTTTDTSKSMTSPIPTGVHARAWAAEPSFSPSTIAKLDERHAYGNSVHVVREVHQQRDEKGESVFEEGGKEMKTWA
jgi:pheromone a factor receptor